MKNTFKKHHLILAFSIVSLLLINSCSTTNSKLIRKTASAEMDLGTYCIYNESDDCSEAPKPIPTSEEFNKLTTSFANSRWRCDSSLQYPNYDFSGKNFSNAQFSGCTFVNAKLNSANFTGADLSNSEFRDINEFIGLNLTNAKLDVANFSGKILDGSNLNCEQTDIFKEKRESQCGVETYNSQANSAICGDDIRREKVCKKVAFIKTDCHWETRGKGGPKTCAHPSFGVKTYKACRHSSFGVAETYRVCGEINNSKATDKCEPELFKEMREYPCEAETYNSQANSAICGDNIEKGRSCKKGPMGIIIDCKDRTKSHGPKTCPHPSFGVKTYKACRHPLFGVETCKN